MDNDTGDTVLLFNQLRPGWDQESLANAYNRHRDPEKRKVWVKPMNFVQDCIRRNLYVLYLPQKKKMPGRPPGRWCVASLLPDFTHLSTIFFRRTEFTAEDDDELCRYLAITCPYEEDGGRLGLGVYKELMRNACFSCVLISSASHYIICSIRIYLKHTHGLSVIPSQAGANATRGIRRG